MRLLEIEDSAGPQLGTVAEFAAPLLSKRFMIASARFTFITYTVLWSIEGAIDNALEKQRDMQVVLEEVLVVYLIVSIMWVTRLRNFERFVQPHDERRREAEAEATELRRPPCDVVQVCDHALTISRETVRIVHCFTSILFLSFAFSAFVTPACIPVWDVSIKLTAVNNARACSHVSLLSFRVKNSAWVCKQRKLS